MSTPDTATWRLLFPNEVPKVGSMIRRIGWGDDHPGVEFIGIDETERSHDGSLRWMVVGPDGNTFGMYRYSQIEVKL